MQKLQPGAVNRLACGLMLALTACGTPQPDDAKQPKLVLQLTVDGLRADLLARYADRFGDGGFRYLLENGTVYANAHYQHSNTETIVGHATLSTGAQPSVHGMIGNVWYDAEAGELSYNIEDPEHPLLPVRPDEVIGDQVDPAQQLARTQGRSPVVLLAETLGDKLTSYTGGRAKVFGVSGKDRSAVAMAGHSGKAFWFSTNSGDFVTSTWYYDAYPNWVADWNGERKADRFAGTEWTLLEGTPEPYLLGHQDDRPYETDLRGYGRTFPHRFGEAGDRLLFTQLIVSPIGDQLLADFAKNLVTNEGLGQDDVPDYLSVSFSGIDAVNHFFGPSSLENEDAVLQLDRTLADFIRFIDEAVGLESTVIVLSADHGAAEMPEYMTELGYQAGRLVPRLIIETANRIGQSVFGIDDIVRFYYRPYLYLDDARVAAAGLNKGTVKDSLARMLTLEPGIHLAATPNSVERLPNSKLLGQIRNNYHAARAGDIYVVQDPYWFNFDEGPVVAMHGSPWNYDTHVPVIFAGNGITAQVIHRPVQPADVAPTLAMLLGMSPPASAQGTQLSEVFRGSTPGRRLTR
jgi:predicted AlkP superfamily pyrophosphatase or phosphodiesterase